MSTLTKRERSIAAKYRRYEKAREEAKKFYDRADRLLLELAQVMLVFGRTGNGNRVAERRPVRIREDGRELHIKDVTLGGDVIVGWGHGAVRRYELKVVDP